MNFNKISKMLFFTFSMFSYALFSEPVVSKVIPKVGSYLGGNSVNIQGSGFSGATAVTFGLTPAVSFNVVSDNLIIAVAPVQTPETVSLLVTSPSGNSVSSKASSYIYQGVCFAYATQYPTTTMVPINTSTNTRSPSIVVGNSPSTVAITPDGKKAYVNIYGANTTVAVDLATNTVIGSPISVGSSPNGIAITPDGKRAYVANYGSNNVTPIDLTTNPPTPRTPIPAGTNPIAIAITPNGKFAYVVNTTSTNVTVIDLSTDLPMPTSIVLGGRPVAIVANPDGTRVYVTGVTFNRLREIDTATNMVVRATDLPGPGLNALTITSDSSKLFITNTFNASITPFDLLTNTAGPNIVTETRPDGIALIPNQTRAYVAFEQSNNVGVIDLTQNPPTTILTIPVGNRTGEITTTPDQAPFASFTAKLATAQTQSAFDASESVSPVGAITSYSWDFGDGTSVVTTTPTVKHAYAIAGEYTVTLVVTNTAGTSLFQVFTGQTMRNNGGQNAKDVQTFNINPPPPSYFTTTLKKNEFLTQTEYVLILQWGASPSNHIVFYRIYEDGQLIAEVSAQSPLTYTLHNYSKNSKQSYEITAVDNNNIESSRIVAQKKGKK